MKMILSLSLYVVAAVALTGDLMLRVFGLNRMQYALGLTADETNQTILDSLANITKSLGRVDTVEKALAESKTVTEGIAKAFEAIQKQLLELKKAQVMVRAARLSRGGEVSDECAKHVGAIALLAGIQQGKIAGSVAERAGEHIKSILGLEVKSLSTTEIPLPVNYAAEVVELVSEYGQARKFGTVFPLGGGSVKLPKLKTSPAFGLLAIATQMGEKKPAFEFVTFAAEKWGGIIIVPSELDEDSVVALGQFIARYAAREMAKCEDVVFFTADGTATYASCKGVLLNQDVAATRVVMAAGAASTAELTLANARLMRAKVASAALGRGKYYFHPSFEQLFSTFNSSGDKPYLANGVKGASLDGFPIEWIDVLPAYSTTDAAGTIFGAFGDMSFSYLGVRGGIRFDLSKEFLFDTDQTAMRAIERFIPGHMAADHVAVVKTGTA
jgi:HK97 family phage major capsid protein